MRTTFVRLLPRQSGFTLIEVLVTIVIVAVGLLGLGSLMLKGLQANASSQLRSVAVSQAYDMADRMRANIPGVLAGNYGPIIPSGSASSCSGASLSGTNVMPPSTVPVCAATCSSACSVAGVADMDACVWHRSNAKLLPYGAGAVCKDAANNWYTIYVSWDDDKSGTTSKTFSLRFEP